MFLSLAPDQWNDPHLHLQTAAQPPLVAVSLELFKKKKIALLFFNIAVACFS